MSHTQEPQVTVLPPDKEKIKKLWTVAGILGAITALEFLIAFTMPHGTLKTAIFVGMTIVKAAYIVGEFMHLKYEAKVLLWSILIPMVFIVWMLVAFVYEGMKFSEINF
ncbi:MAG: cytochrome C oxidase subunit IV family protein [Cyclobacteriaceae bacterium]|jgi:cytochrome c oxidase subunit IV|nr:cytochrome C oxidase subunit IV family protein [Cyclobacteriaceae bacterium]